MIYNLVQYLRNNFATETIFINGRIEPAPNRNILVNDTGGDEKTFTFINHATIQIKVQEIDVVKSRKLAFEIFDFLTSKWNIELPAITIDGTLHAALVVKRIAGIQRPYFLGVSETGLYEYTCNYHITFDRK